MLIVLAWDFNKGKIKMPKEFTPENLRLWTYESNYLGENLSDYYILYSHHRDSDILEKSNFECISREIEEFSKELNLDEGFYIQRSSHWAVGWIELLLIHKNNTELLKQADIISGSLHYYPVFDESHFWEKEYKEWTRNFRDECESFIRSEHEKLDYDSNYFIDSEPTEKLFETLLCVADEKIEGEYPEDYYPSDELIEECFKFLNIFENLNVLMNRAEEATKLRGHFLAIWEKIPTSYHLSKINYRLEPLIEIDTTPSWKHSAEFICKNSYRFANSYCLICKKEVQVITKPMPNEISIGGSALALECA